jgi:hypothetical protein
MRSHPPQLGRWLLIALLIVLSTGFIFFAVSLPPASGQGIPADAELLTRQIEFILRMNSAFLAFLGIIGALLTWFFKNNLEDAKRVASLMVREELAAHIEPIIKAEVEHIKKTFRTEQIIGDTIVDYYIPGNLEKAPLEYGLLQKRGFLKVRFWNAAKKPQDRFGSVLVIDFVNCDLIDLPGLNDEDREVQKSAFNQREQIINNTVKELVEMEIGRPIIVIYIRPGSGRIIAIDKLTTTFPELKYYASANTPVSLMGAVVDSAYVAYGDRRLPS